MLLRRAKITTYAVLAFLSCAYLLVTAWGVVINAFFPPARSGLCGRDLVRRVKHLPDGTWALLPDYGVSELALPLDERYVRWPFVWRTCPPVSAFPYVSYSIDRWDICPTSDWTVPAKLPLSDRVAILTLMSSEPGTIAPADINALARGPVIHRIIDWRGMVPAGFVLVSMAVAPLSLRGLHRLRPLFAPTPGLCPKCSYDIRGLDSGVCPECGTTLPAIPA